MRGERVLAEEYGGREQESRRVDTRLDASSQVFPRSDAANRLARAHSIRPPPYYLDYVSLADRLPRCVLSIWCCSSSLLSTSTITGHGFRDDYYARFIPTEPATCPSGEAPDRTRQHILAEYPLYRCCKHCLCAVSSDIFSATIFSPTK